MNEGMKINDLKGLKDIFETQNIKTIVVQNKYPKSIVQEIERFRTEYARLDLSSTLFYTYSFTNMLSGMAALNAIRAEWEKDHPTWFATHEVTLSIYPAIDENNILNFYFIPTWIEKNSFVAGKPMNGKIIDIVGAVRNSPDPANPDRPYYRDVKGYIYDLGSSCP